MDFLVLSLIVHYLCRYYSYSVTKGVFQTMTIKTELKTSHFDQFQCIGGACEDTCCAGWTVTIDKKAFKNYKNTKNANLKPLLDIALKRNRKSINDFDYGKFAMNEQNACSMLDEKGLCSIQTNLGAESLCTTCSVYPRYLKEVNGVLEKSLDVSCPEAARLVLFEENGIDFLEELQSNKLAVLDSFHYKKDMEEFFWTNRMFIITALQNRKHTLETRLMIIGLYIRAIENSPIEMRHENLHLFSDKYLKLLEDSTAEELFKSIQPNYDLQNAITQHFLSNFNTLSIRFKDIQEILNQNLKDDTIERLAIDNKQNYYNNDLIQLALENYLVNYTFSKYDEVEDQSFLQFYSSLTLHFVLLRLLLIGNLHDGKVTKEEIVKIIQSFSKACAHNFNYFPEAIKIITSNQYSFTAQAFNILQLFK